MLEGLFLLEKYHEAQAHHQIITLARVHLGTQVRGTGTNRR